MLTETQKQQAYQNLEKEIQDERDQREEREAVQLRNKERDELSKQNAAREVPTSPYQVYVPGTGQPAASDPIALAKKKADYSFMNVLLTEVLTRKFEQDEKFNDNKAIIQDLVATAVSSIQSARSMYFDDVRKNEEVMAMVNKEYQVELSAMITASGLRGQGMSDEEILQEVKKKLVPVNPLDWL